MSSAVGGRQTRMSPALVGAITTLVLVITTFLAYNANKGLPWVPSKALTVEVGNGANIVPTNEVRIGGTRVGIVTKLTPSRKADGTTTALIDLKLDQTTAPIPVDTLVQVRARSLLGLKFLADEQNGLMPFFTSLSRFTPELANAGQSTGGFFRGLDRTFGALARADASLDATLQIAPGAFRDTAASLRRTRALVGPHIALAKDLQPGIQAAADAAPNLAAATRAGIRGLADTPRFARDFSRVLTQLDSVAGSAVVNRGFDGITQFARSGQPLFEDLSRAQRICGYGSILFRNIASATSDGDTAGNWLRAVPYLPVYATNGESGSASAPLNGTVYPSATFSGLGASAPTERRKREAYAFLHTNPQPVTGQGGRCEPGYETRAFYGGTVDQKLTVGAAGLTTTKPFKTQPPLGSSFPNALQPESEEEEEE